MLAMVLHSPVAVRASVEVVRAFVKMREMLSGHREILRRLDQLEAKSTEHDDRLRDVIDAIRALIAGAMQKERRRERIGFRLPDPRRSKN